jgi:hypothetical protein
MAETTTNSGGFWDFINTGIDTVGKGAEMYKDIKKDNSTTAETVAQGMPSVSVVSNIPITIITGLIVTTVGGLLVYFLTRK